MSGRTKTKVFPLPVNAMPIMSRPDNLEKTKFIPKSKYGKNNFFFY